MPHPFALNDRIRQTLTPAVRPYTDALLAVLDWCKESRTHGGSVGEDDANDIERIIADKLGIFPELVEHSAETSPDEGDPEPRHQPGYAALTSAEQAARQAEWLNARGNDVCPVCLSFRKDGVCQQPHA